MSTYATTYELALGDEQRTTVLVNRNTLEDPTAAVRLDVLDDAGPAVHRDGTAYLTRTQALDLADALAVAAQRDTEPAAGFPNLRPSYRVPRDEALRRLDDAVESCLGSAITEAVILARVVDRLRRVSLNGPVERHTARLVAAAYAEGIATPYDAAQAAETAYAATLDQETPR